MHPYLKSCAQLMMAEGAVLTPTFAFTKTARLKGYMKNLNAQTWEELEVLGEDRMTGYAICHGTAKEQDSYICTIDIDVKPPTETNPQGKDGRPTWDMLVDAWPELTNTLTVGTPSGGVHYYYRVNELPKTVCDHELYPAIDFLGKGSSTMGPGSSIGAGGEYKIFHEAPIAQLPEGVHKIWTELVAPKPQAFRKAKFDEDSSITPRDTKPNEWVEYHMMYYVCDQMGLVLDSSSYYRGDKVPIRCPFGEHAKIGTSGSKTMILPPCVERARGGLKCFAGKHQRLGWADLRAILSPLVYKEASKYAMKKTGAW